MAETQIRPGIKKKIFFGFVIIGAILFFAGVISIFEFRKINELQSGIVEDNIKSINTANLLLSLTEDYNIKILNTLDQDDAGGDIIEMLADEDFMTQLGQIKDSFTSKRESVMADSVLFAYAAYMQVVREAENIWPEGYQVRSDWYFDRLQSFYVRL
ncbi:MAG: MCP four helix bundle domain-containing protein, partial [Bacteroidales bacterium]|nr:MCP four helix bundle domain-containing protein [Bacteroidales bacterium]